jgi:hypothetical protein
MILPVIDLRKPAPAGMQLHWGKAVGNGFWNGVGNTFRSVNLYNALFTSALQKDALDAAQAVPVLLQEINDLGNFFADVVEYKYDIPVVTGETSICGNLSGSGKSFNMSHSSRYVTLMGSHEIAHRPGISTTNATLP